MNPLYLWLQETLNRLFIKHPTYFKYWLWLSYLGLAVSGIPYLLIQFHIVLPEPFATLSNKAVTWAAGTMLFMSKLTVKAPVIGQTEGGQAITKLDEKAMPFTASGEKKDVADAVPPVMKMPEVPEINKPETTKP